MPSIINASTSGAGGVITTADASGQLELQTAGTTAVTVTSGQNVGIGTASPGSKLQVVGMVSSTGSGTSQVAVGETGTYTLTGVTSPNYGIAYGTLTGRPNPATTISGFDAISFGTNQLERMRIDNSGNLQFNSGYGSVATAYGCRAWVNFNGTGTVAIRASGNVTSITDGGTGNYTVNFTNAMPDANYAPQLAVGNRGTSTNTLIQTGALGTGNFSVLNYESNVLTDSSSIYVSVFR